MSESARRPAKDLQKETLPTMRNKPNLDLLRSFAIALVLLDHICLAKKVTLVGHWMPTWIGVIGVYFFFVHTCLVLMWSLERKPHTLDFYIRRAFRLYPLVAVVVFAVFLLRPPLHIGDFPFVPGDLHLSAGFANLLLVQNIASRPSVSGVLWSLPLEVDMYLLLPLLFFFVRRNFSLWPLLLIWGMMMGNARSLHINGNCFVTVIPCFLPGVMAYVLYRRTRPRLPAWLFPVFLLALCVGFMQHPSVPASWPMCLALGLALPFFRQIQFAPLIRATHEIAKYSYGVYLSHSFAITLGIYLLPHANFLIQLAVIFASTAILSIAAYHLVEKPMIDLGARVAARAETGYEQKHLSAYV